MGQPFLAAAHYTTIPIVGTTSFTELILTRPTYPVDRDTSASVFLNYPDVVAAISDEAAQLEESICQLRILAWYERAGTAKFAGKWQV